MVQLCIFTVIVACFQAAMYAYEENSCNTCQVTPYEGRPGQVIATFTPTLPGHVSFESSTNVFDYMSNIFSAVPVVGGVLGGLLDVIGTATNNEVSNMLILKEAIDDLIDDITTTINDLKDYVDAKFDEFDYDLKTQSLHGIYYSAGYCQSFGKPDNVEDCLKSLKCGHYKPFANFLPN